jgi:hypothetical protein
MSLKVYKKSNGQFVCGDADNEITPAGTYRLTIRGNTLTFHNVFTEKIKYQYLVTDIKKENGTAYSSLSDFITGVGDFFVKPSANSGWQRHDDMQGIMSTVTGGSALGTLAIRDTGCTMLAFQNNGDDVAVQIYQFTHRKKLNTNLDSVHLHYYLPSAPGAGQTIILNYAWTWYNNGGVVPAIANWNTGQKIHTFTGSEAAYSTGIINVITDLKHPINEQYSSMLRVKVTRDSTGVGSDTYNADLGIDYFDVHFITDRQGSIYEYTDIL